MCPTLLLLLLLPHRENYSQSSPAAMQHPKVPLPARAALRARVFFRSSHLLQSAVTGEILHGLQVRFCSSVTALQGSVYHLTVSHCSSTLSLLHQPQWLCVSSPAPLQNKRAHSCFSQVCYDRGAGWLSLSQMSLTRRWGSPLVLLTGGTSTAPCPLPKP